MWIPSPDQVMLFLILMFGFYLGRKLPTNRKRIRMWLFHRRGTAYFSCYILDAGKVVNWDIVAQIENSYKVGDKEYLLTARVLGEGGSRYTPYISMGGMQNVFHTKDNVNPLEFKEKKIDHLYNDPDIIASMVANKDIKHSIAGDYEEISAIKRYVLIVNTVLALAVVAIVWMLVKM